MRTLTTKPGVGILVIVLVVIGLLPASAFGAKGAEALMGRRAYTSAEEKAGVSARKITRAQKQNKGATLLQQGFSKPTRPVVKQSSALEQLLINQSNRQAAVALELKVIEVRVEGNTNAPATVSRAVTNAPAGVMNNDCGISPVLSGGTTTVFGSITASTNQATSFNPSPPKKKAAVKVKPSEPRMDEAAILAIVDRARREAAERLEREYLALKASMAEVSNSIYATAAVPPAPIIVSKPMDLSRRPFCLEHPGWFLLMAALGIALVAFVVSKVIPNPDGEKTVRAAVRGEKSESIIARIEQNIAVAERQFLTMLGTPAPSGTIFIPASWNGQDTVKAIKSLRPWAETAYRRDNSFGEYLGIEVIVGEESTENAGERPVYFFYVTQLNVCDIKLPSLVGLKCHDNPESGMVALQISRENGAPVVELSFGGKKPGEA